MQQMDEMQGAQPRTVVVTGATSGIGEACVIQLVEAGHRVVAVGRRGVRLHELALRCTPGRVRGVIPGRRRDCDIRQSYPVYRCGQANGHIGAF